MSRFLWAAHFFRCLLSPFEKGASGGIRFHCGLAASQHKSSHPFFKGGSAVALLLACLWLASCASGPPRRVSEPTASIQQLTVRSDGSWSIDLRLQNYSSIPMRFEGVSLAIKLAEEDAGTLQHQPRITIGPETADVTTVTFTPSAGARILLADALADGRGVDYALDGTIDASPDDREKVRSYEIERKSGLSPVPGLPGVLR